MEGACSWDGSHGKVKIEETDGSCCGQKSTTSLSLFLGAYGFEVEEELSTMGYSVLGRRSLDWKNGVMSKKEAWMRQIGEVKMAVLAHVGLQL